MTTTRVGWRWTATLFLLAPLVGEFLLGNLGITWLPALVLLAPLYGGGAVLIRELARRLGLGWPGIVLLGLAYATIEEALVTQSLFDPNYVGLRLLDYGYIEALGIGSWWTVFVLGLHTLWSTATPIALTEALAGSAHRSPWLGRPGLAAVAVVFVLGCLATAATQQGDFRATPWQRMGAGAAVLMTAMAALAAGRVRAALDRARASRCPAPLTVGLVAFGLASAFMTLALLLEWIPAWVNVAGMLASTAVAAGLAATWSRSRGWTPRHELAFAGGYLFTYGWYGFVQLPSVGGVDPVTDALGNLVFTGAAVVVFVLAWRRTAPPTQSALSAAMGSMAEARRAGR